MDSVFTGIALLVAAATIFFIAFPHFLFPEKEDEKEKVGPVYWGVYDGQPVDEVEAFKKIEIRKTKGKEKVVAGSATYALGRGTSFRG